MLVIENDGEIETSALTLVGASTKDETKIGFFGSGNKYAMAVLLRNGIKFDIWSGLRHVDVKTEKVTLRDQTYDRIVIDGEPTSLTTRMGPDWKIWFAAREFICNAMDEGGFKRSFGAPVPKEGKTVIAVSDSNPEIAHLCSHYSKYIRNSENVLSISDKEYGRIEILKADDEKLNVYRKGISVIGDLDTKSLFWYDIESLSISEARVFSDEYQLNLRMCKALVETDSAEVIDRYVKNWRNEEVYEHKLFSWYATGNPSEAWHTYMKGKIGCAEKYRERFPPEDMSLYVFLPNKLSDMLKEEYNDLDFVGEDNTGGFVEDKNTDLSSLKERVTLILCQFAANNVRVNSKIRYGTFSNDAIVAMYMTGIDEIRLAVSLREHTDYELGKTLLEEYSHSTGLGDGTRSFEDYLLGLIVKEWLK